MKIALVSRWRLRALEVASKITPNALAESPTSERAIGEAQGYIMALRECADELEKRLESGRDKG